MLLANRAAFSSKGVVLHLLHKQNKIQMLQPLSYSVICNRINTKDLQNINNEMQFLRSIHVTKVNKDLEAGLKALGAGLAVTGLIGPGIGIGIIFGNLLIGCSRNPSLSDSLKTSAILGTGFCEALGLFAVMLAFVIKM